MSLPHQPPLYGVISSKPVMSVITGPTSVPCRVAQPSMVPGRWLMRFITLSASPRIFGA